MRRGAVRKLCFFRVCGRLAAGLVAMGRLLVIGGSGYLGRHVVRAGLAQGLKVASLSRSGSPPATVSVEGMGDAEWIQGPADDAAVVARALEGKTSVISCLGTPFGTKDSILHINGATNVAITEAAKAAGVERYVFISAATFRLMERLFPDSWGAYFEGKRQAEAAVARHFGEAGATLKPGIIYTDSFDEFRGQAGLGLKETKMPGFVGAPMAAVTGASPVQWMKGHLGPVGDFLAPPSCVSDVAAAAVEHVVRSSSH